MLSDWLSDSVCLAWPGLAVPVQVSGVSEGAARNVLQPEADGWFESNDSMDPPPWVEIVLPANVTIMHLTRCVLPVLHQGCAHGCVLVTPRVYIS